MKIGIAAVIAAVLIIVAVGGYWYMTSEEADEWTEPWSDTSVFDGEWKTRVDVEFEDGTVESIENIQSQDSLTVYYNASPVKKFTWYLEALASTPAGHTAWDKCEIDIRDAGTLRLDTLVNGDPPYTDDFFFPLYEDQNVKINIDTAPYYQTVCSRGINLDTATENMDSGIYQLMFSPAGTCYYRGISIYYPDVDPDGHGDWVEISSPNGVAFTIDVRNTGVTVDFQSNVIWE